jgi:hypothetical protein
VRSGEGPRPDARPRPRPVDAAAPDRPGAPSEGRPEPVTRTAAVHRNEIAPLERRPRAGANARPADGVAAAQQGAPVDGAGPANGTAPSSPALGTPVSDGSPSPTGRPRPVPAGAAAGTPRAATRDGDPVSTAERSLHASTVAVRVVALAAVAPAVAAARREPEQTEAS